MNVEISITDWVGKINNGIAVLLSLIIDDNQYEIIYWFNEKEINLEIENSFYKKYNIKDIKDYEYFNHLIYYIDNFVLPDKQEIFKEFKL